MPSTKVKTKSSATVPANDRRTATRATAEEAPDEKPKTIITYFNGGESIKITQPNGATEKWSIVHKPMVTKEKKQYNLEAAMRCGHGSTFDKPHTFYLDVRAHLRLAAHSTLKGKLNKEWDAVSIEEKHSVISSTKLAFPYGYRFPGDWAYEEMFKRVLRNARDTKTNKQGRRQGTEAALIVTNENEPAHEAEVDVQVEDADADEHAQASNNNGNADHSNSSHGNDDENDDENDDKNDDGHAKVSKRKGKARAIEEDMEEDVEEEETDEEEQFAPRLKNKAPIETSDEEEDSEEDEPIASTIRASSSAVEIINSTSSQTGSQSTIAPDSPMPVTTKTKGAAKKRGAPEGSDGVATNPPTSSKKPRKTGPSVKPSIPSPLSSSSSTLSLPSSPAPAPVSDSVRPSAAASTTAKAKKRTAPEVAEEPPAKKLKTQSKPKTTVDTQAKQKANSTPKAAKLTSAAPARADSWAADYQQELNDLPPVKTQKKTKKKASKAALPEPDSSTPFEPSEPSTSTSTAPRPSRPRPKMRPQPPPEESSAPTTTCNAKAELVDAVEMGNTKAVKNTRSRAAKGAKTS